MHGCVLNIVATDALVLKHQVISIHSADKTLCWTSFIEKLQMYIYMESCWENWISFEKKRPVLGLMQKRHFRVNAKEMF